MKKQQTGTLERDRLKNNLIDRVEKLERRYERQQAQIETLRSLIENGLYVEHLPSGTRYRLIIIMTDGVYQLAMMRVNQ